MTGNEGTSATRIADAARGLRWKRGLVVVALFTAALFVLASATLFAGRLLLAERGVPVVQSISDELDVQRILVVLAHPDDELVATELISRAVTEGAHVSLLTATRGEAGSQNPEIVDQRHLGVVREAEVYRHGFALGVHDQTVLELGDGRLDDYPVDELAALISGEIERAGPDLLVTFHPESGLSMHADHLAIGGATVRAARTLIAENRADRMRIAYALAPRPALRLVGGSVNEQVAQLQPEPDFALVADASLKRRGWRIHASQARHVPARTGIPVWLAYALGNREYYAVEQL